MSSVQLFCHVLFVYLVTVKSIIFLITLMTCVLLSAAAAQSSAPSTAAEKEVRSVIRDIDSALKARDRSKLAHFMADDFAMLHSTGKLEDRQSFLDRAGTGSLASQRIPAEVVEDTIRVYARRTALRTTRIKATIHPPDRAPLEMSLRSIDVYAKIKGRWLWVSEQSTPIPSEPGLARQP
jgi:uncharacterized protein (TIGR02246 family)